MSFPRYPEDKDSGVEWLGEVPGHWEVKALKNVISRIESGVSVNAIDTPAAEGEIGVLKTSCVYRGWFDPAENKAVVPEEYERVACPVTAGTLIVSRMNTPDLVGAAGMVGESHPGLFLPDRLWQVHFADAHAAFIHYWTHSPLYRAQVQQVCAGASSSMQNLAQDQFRAFTLALPPVREQKAIATFLDRETGKIDALVAEQQNLIALLKEKRQALISHAVTKGLDPDVPMKDSGVVWLGEVPAHWAVGNCGFYLRILSGFAFPSSGFTDDDSAHRLLRGANVGVSRLKWDDTVYWQRSEGDGLDDYEMVEGDLVIGMDRPLIGEGMRVAKVTAQDLPSLLLQRVASLKVGNKLHPDYLHYLLASEMFIAHFSPETTGVSVPHISPDQINKFVIPIPPMSEQLAIVNDVKRLLAEFGGLIAESEIAVGLLQERRTALISAAVTGQIDVRGTPEQAP